MNRRRQRLLLGLLLVGLTQICVSPASAAPEPDHHVIRVALLESEPILFTGSDGVVQGFGVDVLTLATEGTGWEIQYVRCDREESFNLLRRHEVDLVFPMTRTPERDKEFDFSESVLVSTWAEIYARNAGAYTSITDLTGWRVACVDGTFFTTEFLRLVHDFGLEPKIVYFKDYEAAYRAVGQGEADAAVGPSTGYRDFVRENHLAPTAIVFAPAPGRFMTARGMRPELLAQIDRWFAAQGDSREAELNRLHTKWFGVSNSHGFPRWIAPALGGLVAVALVAVLFAMALRQQVRVRTRELFLKNAALKDEVARRVKAQEELSEHKEHLEVLVQDRTAALERAQDELIRKERLAVLGQLTATVSHELRNPMATIRGTVFVLEKQACSSAPNLAPLFDRVNRNVERCDRIIDELLDYARVRTLERAPTDLGPWLGGLLEELGLPPGITMQLTVERPVTASIDRERLWRCLQNLIINACHAIQQGNAEAKGHLEIRIRRESDDALIDIADDGEGIPPEQLEKVFEPMFSTKSFGIGLGLPLARQIAEAHGGSLQLCAGAVRGLVARVQLPIEA